MWITLSDVKENETIWSGNLAEKMREEGNMDSWYELIDSYWDVLDNVQRFNFALDFDTELCSRLNQFRSWYYIPELDQFGPSQFVGYKWMNVADYKAGYTNGRQQSEPFGGSFDLFNAQTPIEKTSNPNYSTYAAAMGKGQTRPIG